MVPDWFIVLDRDGDGQVGLYEWRQSGGLTANFVAMDLNRDCYLTPKELNEYLAVHPESPFGRDHLPDYGGE
jgi:hypothetical protein